MATRSRIRILLIDDDPESHVAVREFLSRIENPEYVLDSVYEFDSAVARLRDPAHLYDAILLDHYLGEHTGIEILRELQITPLLPPVIVLTGSDDKALDHEAMSLGASDFLVKSQINPALLDRSIRYAIEHRKNERRIVLKQREIASKLMGDPLSVIRSRALSIQRLVQEDPNANPKIREASADIIAMVRRMTDLKNKGLRNDSPGNSPEI